MKARLVLVCLPLALAACSAPLNAANTPDQTTAAHTNATVSARVAEAFAQTQTAQPSRTSSLTPFPSPLPPTLTPQPAASSPTELATTLAPAFTETFTPSLSPTPFQGTLAPGGVPNDGRVTLIVVFNDSDYKEATISLNGVSENGNYPLYLAYDLKRSVSFSVPWGTYKYYITIGGKKRFSGEFRVSNWDKTSIIIRNDKVLIQGP